MSALDTMQEYYDSPAVNQSLVKFILGSQEEEEIKLPGRKKSMELGSLVDLILTVPVEEWENKILTVEAEDRPSESMDRIITHVYKNRETSTDLHQLRNLIEEAIEIINYKGNASWSTTQRINKVIEKCSEHWEFLMLSEGRTVTLISEMEKAYEIADQIRHSPNTLKYFREDNFITQAYYQYAIYETLEEVPCKGLLDKCIINDKDKEILPIDFKVTGSISEWARYIARKFRYDIQASFYTNLLKKKYPDYKILPFTFIVASANPKISPYVYECTEMDLYIGEHGANRHKGLITDAEDEHVMRTLIDPIHGYKQGLEIYKQCKRLGLENYDLDSYLTNRTSQLNLWG